MRNISRVITVAAATTALALGAAGAASAERTTNSDAAGGVYFGPSGSQGQELDVAESRDSGVDLKSLAVSHGTDRVGITAKFFKLNEDAQLAVFLRLNGKKDATRVVFNGDDKTAIVVPYSEDDSDDEPQLSEGAQAAVKDNGTYCDNQPVSVKLGKNGTISMSISRFCLGYPKSLRAAAGAYIGNTFGSDGSFRDYLGSYDEEPQSASDLKYTASLSRG